MRSEPLGGCGHTSKRSNAAIVTFTWAVYARRSVKAALAFPRLPDSRDFRKVWIASIISQLGDWSARLAIGILIFDRTGSAVYVGTAALIFIAPYFGFGQILTAWAERFQRRTVMVNCDALRGAAFVALALLDPPLPIFFAILFISASADPVFEANVSATIVESVDTTQYDAAIRLRHLSLQAATLGGLGLGGLLVGWFDARQVLLADALTFAFSALILGRITARRHAAGESPSIRETFMGGIDFLRRDQTSRNAVLATMLTIAAGMSVQAQSPVLGKELADLEPQMIGVLAMLAPAGSIFAITVVSTAGSDRRLYYRNLVVSIGAAAVAAVLIGLSSRPVALFIAFFTLGFVYQTSMTSNIIVGKRIPSDRRAVVFGMLQALIIISNGAGAWLGGLFIELFGPGRGAQVGLAMAGLAALAVIPRATTRVAAAPHGYTTRRGEQLTIDLSDHSSMARTSPLTQTSMGDS
ncbi:MAG: MFS transporter [Acidimicrobiales bacterium]